MLKYSLGIDVSKKDFHACLSVIDVNQHVKVKASRKFSNNQQGFKELLLWLGIPPSREYDAPPKAQWLLVVLDLSYII